jgi:hypothetical protein
VTPHPTQRLPLPENAPRKQPAAQGKGKGGDPRNKGPAKPGGKMSGRQQRPDQSSD